MAGTPGAACDICAREAESARGAGRGARHTEDAHLARLCSGARSQEAEVKVKRCGGATAPFARLGSLQEPRASAGRPTLPFVFASAEVR